MIVFTTSVTRLLDYLFNIWAFNKLKIAPKHIKFAKLSSKCFQIQNELVQNGQSFLTFCQSGEILPNLVTLFTTLRVTLQTNKLVVSCIIVFALVKRSTLVRTRCVFVFYVCTFVHTQILSQRFNIEHSPFGKGSLYLLSPV